MTISRPLGRAISPSLSASVESSATGEVLLCFATITHDDLEQPIYVVAEDDGAVSYQNGAIVNYRWGGNLYLGMPFFWTIISDTEQVPRANLMVMDVENRIGPAIITLLNSPRIRLDLLKLSDFTDSVDEDNARTEIDSAVPEFTADYLYLTDVSGDVASVSSNVTTYDLSSDPWPYPRCTRDRMPGLFLK